MNFTIELIIQQLELMQFFGTHRFNKFDKIEVGIRAARSFHCLSETPGQAIEVQPNGYELRVNEYPGWFRSRVVSIIARYLKAKGKNKLITTFDYNKKCKARKTEKGTKKGKLPHRQRK